MKLSTAAFALALACASSSAIAATCGNTAQGFDGFLAQIKKEAIAQGISGQALAVLDTVQYDTGVIKRDRAQNVFAQSFLQFAGRMASDARIV